MPTAACPVHVDGPAFRNAVRLGVRQTGTGNAEVFRELVGAVARVRVLQPVDVLEPEGQVGQRLRLEPDHPGVEFRQLGLVVDQD